MGGSLQTAEKEAGHNFNNDDDDRMMHILLISLVLCNNYIPLVHTR